MMMANDLVDDEADELLTEIGIELGLFGKAAQPRDLPLLARGVGRGQVVRGLVGAHRLGDAEPLGQHVDQRGVDVVDARAERGEVRIGSGSARSGMLCHRAGR